MSLNAETYACFQTRILKLSKRFVLKGKATMKCKMFTVVKTPMISLLIAGWSDQERPNDQEKLHPPRCGACYRKNRDDVLMNNSCTHKLRPRACRAEK
jgi:hypothetical protein